MAAYPAHLKSRLQRMRNEIAAYRNLSLHHVWRRVLANIAIGRGESPTEHTLVAIALELHADAVVHNDVLHPNVAAVSRTMGLNSPEVLGSRIRRGLSLEEAVQQVNFRRRHHFDGKWYPNLASASKALRLPYSKLIRCMKRGMSFEDAVRYLQTQFCFEGQSYPTLKKAADTLGLNAASLRSCMNLGMSFEHAVHHVRTGQPKSAFSFDGKKYRSTMTAERALGLASGSIEKHMQPGRTFEEAVRFLLAKPHFIFKGKRYPNVDAAARALGLNANKIRERMRKDESFENSVHYLVALKAGWFWFNGKRYRTEKAAAESLGFHYTSVTYRMRHRAETFEQAVRHLIAFAKSVREGQSVTAPQPRQNKH